MFPHFLVSRNIVVQSGLNIVCTQLIFRLLDPAEIQMCLEVSEHQKDTRGQEYPLSCMCSLLTSYTDSEKIIINSRRFDRLKALSEPKGRAVKAAKFF